MGHRSFAGAIQSFAESLVFFGAPSEICLRVPRLLLAAALVLFATSAARAGCGDYVRYETPSGPEQPAPCRGPHCSKPSEPLPLVPATVGSVPGEQSAHVTAESSSTTDDSESLLSESTSLVPDGPTSRLDRPPRTGPM
jgi:hypothetical protein